MTPTQLINQLVEKGGAIVGSGECSELEIADAQSTGRFAVDESAMGFVRRYPEWLAMHKDCQSLRTQLADLSQRDAANARAESADRFREEMHGKLQLSKNAAHVAEERLAAVTQQLLQSQAQATGLRDALEGVLDSAHPHAAHNPAMFAAWHKAGKVLEKANSTDALRAHDLALAKELHDTATSILMHRTTLGHYTLKDITSIIDQALAEVTEDTLSGGKEGA